MSSFRGTVAGQGRVLIHLEGGRWLGELAQLVQLAQHDRCERDERWMGGI
jgi:hypothetical protein